MRVGEVEAASLSDWTSHRCYLWSRNTEEMQTRRCVCLRDVQMELSKRQLIQKTAWSSRRKGGKDTFKSPSHLQSGCHTGWFKQKSHLLKGHWVGHSIAKQDMQIWEMSGNNGRPVHQSTSQSQMSEPDSEDTVDFIISGCLMSPPVP